MTQAIPGSEAFDAFVASPRELFIDGKWTPALSGETFDVIDPGLGLPFARAAAGGVEDVQRAVSAARNAFDDGRWSGLPGSRRSEVLWKIADLLEANIERLAYIEARDNGMPLSMARMWHVSGAARCFRYYAGLADHIYGDASDVQVGPTTFAGYTRKEPIGVAGLIIPWNGPLTTAAWKVSAALAAGCSFVLKPAEDAPLSSILLCELLAEAGVPDGVANLVTGLGAAPGEALVDSLFVDKISFTGSTAVGKRIVERSAGNLKRLTLELGGKSPVIVFDDADLGPTIDAAAAAIFWQSGQACTAGSRLFVQRGVFDEVVAGVVEKAKTIKAGYCLDEDSVIGPLISERHLDRVMGYVATGVEEGATVAVGGGALDRPGNFVEPTVLTDVTNEMRVVREEIFGPVLAVMPFDTAQESIALANDTTYGLAASVFTRDANRATAVARRLRAGRVGINVHTATNYQLPFGGFKESGWGREHGPRALDEFMENKTVVMAIDPTI